MLRLRQQRKRRRIRNEGKKIPMRMCVGCKELKPKKELVRIVVLPTGVIELDRTGKKSGRGVYVCDSMDCFNKAYENHGLENR